MHEKSTKSILLSLWLITTSCSTVQIPDTEFCAVAGVIYAGADCAHTIKDQPRSMSRDEFFDFLEPNETKGAALCQSATDAEKLKTALEQACKILGNKCTYEQKQALVSLGKAMKKLTAKRAGHE